MYRGSKDEACDLSIYAATLPPTRRMTRHAASRRNSAPSTNLAVDSESPASETSEWSSEHDGNDSSWSDEEGREEGEGKRTSSGPALGAKPQQVSQRPVTWSSGPRYVPSSGGARDQDLTDGVSLAVSGLELEAGGGQAAAGVKKSRRSTGAPVPAVPIVRKVRPPKEPKERQNFVRLRSGKGSGKFASKFLSKAGATGRTKRFRKRLPDGRLLYNKKKTPGMAGQGAEYLDGFQSHAANRCHLCGQPGHWAKDCPLDPVNRLADEAQGSDQEVNPSTTNVTTAWGCALESELATTPDALGTAGVPGVLPPRPHHQLDPFASFQAQCPADRIFNCHVHYATEVVDLPEDVAGTCPGELSEVQLQQVLSRHFGHSSFRHQQLAMIQKVLRGESLLGVMPTGAGKSLCYQLPAVLLPGVVVVVSPLLALMKDQLARLPVSLSGAMLSGELMRSQVERILGDVAEGKVKILYIAPEKLTNSVVMSALQRASPLSLVCVDEAHCVSEWGHAFRPAYYRLGHVLQKVLKPKAVLAVTATATRATQKCITEVLGIQANNIICEAPLRTNLRLEVQRVVSEASQGSKFEASYQVKRALCHLLKVGKYTDAQVLVYVNYKETANDLANFLLTNQIDARAYHAGLPTAQRDLVQRAFCEGRCRVVVATVAFGMGLDTGFLRAVVHLSMPKSMEEYVQQVGRAGRLGDEALCHLFLDDQDYLRSRSLTFSGGVDLPAVKRFLERVFRLKGPDPRTKAGKKRRKGMPDQTEGRYAASDDEEADKQGGVGDVAVRGSRKRSRKSVGDDEEEGENLPLGNTSYHYGILNIAEASADLDMKEESMESILTYLQAETDPHVVVLPTTSAFLTIYFHQTAPEKLAEGHPVIAALLKCKSRAHSGRYKVGMAQLVASGQLPPSHIIHQLSFLAGMREIHFEMSTKDRALAWQVLRHPLDLDSLAVQLHKRLQAVEHQQATRLDVLYGTLATAAKEDAPSLQEEIVRKEINAYFNTMEEEAGAHDLGSKSPANIPLLAPFSDISASYPDVPWPLKFTDPSLSRQLRAFFHQEWQQLELLKDKLSGRAVAQILHGLHSPLLPSKVWRKSPWWGSLVRTDFSHVLKTAVLELAEWKRMMVGGRER